MAANLFILLKLARVSFQGKRSFELFVQLQSRQLGQINENMKGGKIAEIFE